MHKPTKAAVRHIQRGRPATAPPPEIANRRGIAKPDATGERDRGTKGLKGKR